VRLICCQQCERALYRTDGSKLIAPSDADGSMTVPPITITIKDQRHTFCSKPCVLRWLIAQPEDKLLGGGYPLW
jgi:hypothetical protein